MAGASAGREQSCRGPDTAVGFHIFRNASLHLAEVPTEWKHEKSEPHNPAREVVASARLRVRQRGLKRVFERRCRKMVFL